MDKDKRTPERFNVTGIPKIVIALPDGSILWEKTGFSDEQEFVAILNTIPNDVMALYQVYFSVLKLTKDSKCACEIAKQFQQLAGKTENKDLQYALIQKNEEFFKKSGTPDLETFCGFVREVCRNVPPVRSIVRTSSRFSS